MIGATGLKTNKDWYGKVLGDTHFLVEEAVGHKGTNQYVTAIENCNKAISHAGSDKELVLDSLSLKGICFYRLGHILEAVRILHMARR